MTAAGQRIAKAIARAGLCSRREAERWVQEGRVAIDGRVLADPAINVIPGQIVTVDGKPLPAAERTRLFRFHKPRGLITTARDPRGRPTVFDGLPAELPRLISVGRLDLNSEGLLLLTNDGGLARALELPSTGIVRRYRARAYGRITQDKLDTLRDGITVEGVRYGPIDANLERRTGRNQWIELTLTEGKNREVRRVLEHLGLQVSRLMRTAYGPFELGDLPRGAAEEVKKHELGRFLSSLRRHHPPTASSEEEGGKSGRKPPPLQRRGFGGGERRGSKPRGTRK